MTHNDCCQVYLQQFIIWKYIKKKVKWCYRPGVAQRVGTGIALLFHDHGMGRGWVVSSTPRPHFTPGKDLVPIWQEAGWTPGPVWTGRKFRPNRDLIPDRPACSQSLYRLSYWPTIWKLIPHKNTDLIKIYVDYWTHLSVLGILR